MAFGKPSKTRFILLTSPRSGSNLLASFLNSHPNIAMYPEIFNLFAVSRSDLDSIVSDPPAYLNRILEKKNLPSKTAVGFKIFYSQANEIQLQPDLSRALCLPATGESWKTKVADVQAYLRQHYDLDQIAQGFKAVWALLQADSSVKVIHLMRKNKLRQFLSFFQASMTDQWKSHDKNSVGGSALFLQFDDCVKFFDTYTAWESEFDQIFCNHNKITMIYEAFQANPDRLLKEIQEFLGVPVRRNLRTGLVKQGRAPLSEAISNYQELKLQFKGSQWESFFED